MTKILILDIETSPHIAYVWGAWRQNVGQNQWVQKTYIMSYAAKWLGDTTIYYGECRDGNDFNIVFDLYGMLNQADIVVAHNGKKFDIPVILGRGAVHGFTPPSPYFIVDTRDVARKELRLVSNSLANLCEEFGLPLKSGHKKFPGFELWVECLKGNDEAWEEMRDYNIDDIISLEALYLRLRPYMSNHPNVVHFVEGEEAYCPKCGSLHIQWRGYVHTKAGLCYRRCFCADCGGWGRARFGEKDIKTNNVRNA